MRQALKEMETSGAAAPAENLPPVTAHQLTLQVAALHKGFLALSDAFTEQINVAQRQSEAWDGRQESLRRELGAKLGAAAAQGEVQALARQGAGLQAQGGLLADRLARVEDVLEGCEAGPVLAARAAAGGGCARMQHCLRPEAPLQV